MIGKWTTGEIDTLRCMADEGRTYREIAEALDRTEGAVNSKALALGLQRMPKRTPNIHGTLCWDCVNATNSRCSWSKRFIPVEGWTATKTRLNVTTRYVESYIVHECPQFEEG